MRKVTEKDLRGALGTREGPDKKMHPAMTEPRKWKVKIKRITARPPHKVT